MAVWLRQILWSVMFLLAGAGAPSVNYPRPGCAVRGSTVTLPCTFTTLQSVLDINGKEVLIQILRVVWCQKHEICQGGTPSVYDSEERNNKNNPRYTYLGDMKGDCTLQITHLQMEDDETLRFRVEADNGHAQFTGRPGVRVRVTESTQMQISSSSADGQVKAGEAVTLNCTADCTFHQLEVTWLRDGHALRETGPALQLSAVTAGDSGSYTCGLKSVGTVSRPYSLQVEAAEAAEAAEAGGKGELFLIVAVVFGVLLALSTLILVFCIIKSRRAAAAAAGKEQPVAGEAELKRSDDLIYSNILPPAEQEGGDRQQEGSGAVDDVSYAAVQFKHKNQARAAEEAEDAIIYSSVASRG